MDDRAAEALSSVRQGRSADFASVTVVIYVMAFVTGGIVMGFEMLGSRYLNPYFGSDIYTWTALISRVLAALCVDYLRAIAQPPSVGTLSTTFYLIPMIGSRAITISLVLAGVVARLVLLATQRWSRQASAAVALIAVTGTLTSTVFPAAPARGEELIDLETRKVMLARKNGLIAHIETTYNDIFIAKKQAELSMSFQVKGWEWDQATVNLNDPDDVVFPVMRQMSTAVVYPKEAKKS